MNRLFRALLRALLPLDRQRGAGLQCPRVPHALRQGRRPGARLGLLFCPDDQRGNDGAMTENQTTGRAIPILRAVVSFIVLSAALYGARLHSYVLFHSLVELFSVVVAFSIFTISPCLASLDLPTILSHSSSGLPVFSGMFAIMDAAISSGDFAIVLLSIVAGFGRYRLFDM